jgi:hypothetical protein
MPEENKVSEHQTKLVNEDSKANESNVENTINKLKGIADFLQNKMDFNPT